MSSARSLNWLLHGMLLLYGAATVTIGLRKSSGCQPAARKFERLHATLTVSAELGVRTSPVIAKEFTLPLTPACRTASAITRLRAR